MANITYQIIWLTSKGWLAVFLRFINMPMAESAPDADWPVSAIWTITIYFGGHVRIIGYDITVKKPIAALILQKLKN